MHLFCYAMAITSNTSSVNEAFNYDAYYHASHRFDDGDEAKTPKPTLIQQQAQCHFVWWSVAYAP